MLIRGDFVHCPTLGDLQILSDHCLAVSEEGYIISFAPFSETSTAFGANSDLIQIPKGSFLLPTFCDLHLHAPQYLYQGTGLDLPLMEWLDRYAYQAEERMDADPQLARRVYERLAQRLVENGTAAVMLFGTIKEETNLVLAESMQKAGIRAFVGKLSMDKSTRETYTESSTSESLKSARSFIQNCRQITSHLPAHQQLVEPVLTPRFVPTSSDEQLLGLGQIAKADPLVRIQSHLAEAKDQVAWVRDERGLEDIDVFEKAGLLTSRTVQAHCTFLDSPDLNLLHRHGTSVAHCPLSNMYFSAEKAFPLREALLEKLKVGLGTDIAGGYSLDIMSSMRHAVSVSRLRQGAREERGEPSLAIDWKESLYLATRGGAEALSLPLVGKFEIGCSFDAQEIKLFHHETKTGLGSLDFFDLDESTTTDISQDMVEKWWCVGDARNRGRVWVQGRQIGQFS